MKNNTALLDLRADAVLVFSEEELEIRYGNPAARKLLGEIEEGAKFSAIFEEDSLPARLIAGAGEETAAAVWEDAPWFDEPAMLHALALLWDDEPCVALTIGRRSHGTPPDALKIIRAVLSESNFIALRVDCETMAATVLSSGDPLTNTQARFDDCGDFIRAYAEVSVHPEDREQFVSAFSPEQFRIFREMSTSPSCAVRHRAGDEYRWASFSLTAVDASAVLLLGKDSTQQHMEQERSDMVRAELRTLSDRNRYIVDGVSDIFRLLLHIDLKTGETMILTMHPGLRELFSMEKIYPFEEIVSELLKLVHPDDRDRVEEYSRLPQYEWDPQSPSQNRYVMQYRRITPGESPDESARWTRSVLTLLRPEEGKPTEAYYSVQDIDLWRRREIENKRIQETLTAQFYTLIRNRFLWFIEGDYGTQTATCYRIENREVQPPIQCPFGQFFERMIMPNCHPDDYKRVALALLPSAAKDAFEQGKREITVEYRHRDGENWRYARAEMYLRTDELSTLHSMLYISDIDSEVQDRDRVAKAEHEQLVLRRKFGLMIQDAFVQIGEVDLDGDIFSHYEIEDRDIALVRDELPFSICSEAYPERFIHPDQRALFRQYFSYEAILQAARDRVAQIKHLFLFDIHENKQYYWCNVAVRFFHDDNGKNCLMSYVENVDDEIRKRDAQLHAVTTAKEKLQDSIRAKERARIRKAHFFLNLASSFQLALNQVYATLTQLEHALPPQETHREDFRSLFTMYERLSAMTECAKDVMLLENNQLPLLKEPVSLPQMVWNMKRNTMEICQNKSLRLTTYTSNVTQETVTCDSGRLSFLFDNIFINVIRTLPDGSAVTLRLSQQQPPEPAQKNTAVYEFSLITYGDRVSQDIQSGICSPIPFHDPLKTIEEESLSHNADHSQHNLYLSKRLIALMNGTLEFVKLPGHASAVTLRLPFPYVPQEVVFPQRFLYGKHIFVWDSDKHSAMATMEILRETGMRLSWQENFENLLANLKLCRAQHEPCDILLLRYTDMEDKPAEKMRQIRDLEAKMPIVILDDAVSPERIEMPEHIYHVEAPLFRSTLSAVLRQIADDAQ